MTCSLSFSEARPIIKHALVLHHVRLPKVQRYICMPGNVGCSCSGVLRSLVQGAHLALLTWQRSWALHGGAQTAAWHRLQCPRQRPLCARWLMLVRPRTAACARSRLHGPSDTPCLTRLTQSNQHSERLADIQWSLLQSIADNMPAATQSEAHEVATLKTPQGYASLLSLPVSCFDLWRFVGELLQSPCCVLCSGPIMCCMCVPPM